MLEVAWVEDVCVAGKTLRVLDKFAEVRLAAGVRAPLDTGLDE